MEQAPHQTYAFGEFTLDLTSGRLLRNGAEIPVRPKSFELLKFLVLNPDRLVSKDELMAAVWPGTFVTDDALLKRMKDLREALDDDGQRYIRTVARRGYIFNALVGSNEVAAAPVTEAAPRVIPRYVAVVAGVALFVGVAISAT